MDFARVWIRKYSMKKLVTLTKNHGHQKPNQLASIELLNIQIHVNKRRGRDLIEIIMSVFGPL